MRYTQTMHPEHRRELIEDFIDRFVIAHRRGPTLLEIAREFHMTRTGSGRSASAARARLCDLATAQGLHFAGCDRTENFRRQHSLRLLTTQAASLCQEMGALVAGIADMPANPVPVNAVDFGQVVQLLPEFMMDMAAPIPGGAFDQPLAVAPQLHAMWIFEQLEGFDGGSQFGHIIGALAEVAVGLLLALRIRPGQDRAPACCARIGFAGAIGTDDDLRPVAAFAFLHRP